MTAPVVNTLPAAPSRNDSPDTFVETADTWVAALPPWTTSVNALGSWMDSTASTVDTNAGIASSAASTAQTAAANAVNAPGTSATSTTTLTPSIASKSLTIQTGKAFSVGQFVVIADTANPTTNYMIGNITSYNSGTGALVVNVTNSAGVAASAWTISLTGAPAQNSLSNDLTFLGSTRRIYGDFSDSTLSNRLSFQSSVANGSTGVVVIPNGTSTQTSITSTNNSDSNNASITYLSTTSTESQLGATKTGAGSNLPLNFYTGGVSRFSLSPTASRFQADFSNGTLANRLLFQTNVVNGATGLVVIPNGTSTSSAVMCTNKNDPDNSSLMYMQSTSTVCEVVASKTGTGSLLPLALNVGGAQRLFIGTGGDLIQFNPAGNNALYAVRATDASASAARTFASALQNENAVAVTSVVQNAQTDGGSSIDFYTTPAGSRTVDRRTAHWRINANGYLQNISNTMPRFHVKRTTTATLDTSVMFHPTASGTVCYNIGSGYNTSTGDFTAPVAGLYQFCYDVKVVNSGAGTVNVTFGISQTGSTYPVGKQSQYQNNGETLYYNGSACIYMAAGDVVKLTNLSGVLSASLTWEGAFQGALLH